MVVLHESGYAQKPCLGCMEFTNTGQNEKNMVREYAALLVIENSDSSRGLKALGSPLAVLLQAEQDNDKITYICEYFDQ